MSATSRILKAKIFTETAVMAVRFRPRMTLGAVFFGLTMLASALGVGMWLWNTKHELPIVRQLRFSPDDSQLLIAALNYYLGPANVAATRVSLDMATLAPNSSVRRIHSETAPVLSDVDVAIASRRVLACLSDRIWVGEVAGQSPGKLIKTASSDACFDPTEANIVLPDGVWNIESGKQVVRSQISTNDSPHTVSISADGELAVSATHEGAVYVWNVHDGQVLRQIASPCPDRIMLSPTMQPFFCEDGTVILSACLDREVLGGTFFVVDPRTGEVLKSFTMSDALPTVETKFSGASIHSANGRFLAIDDRAGYQNARILDLVTGEWRKLAEPFQARSPAALSNDGTMLAFTTTDPGEPSIRVVDVTSGKLLYEFPLHHSSTRGAQVAATLFVITFFCWMLSDFWKWRRQRRDERAGVPAL